MMFLKVALSYFSAKVRVPWQVLVRRVVMQMIRKKIVAECLGLIWACVQRNAPTNTEMVLPVAHIQVAVRRIHFAKMEQHVNVQMPPDLLYVIIIWYSLHQYASVINVSAVPASATLRVQVPQEQDFVIQWVTMTTRMMLAPHVQEHVVTVETVHLKVIAQTVKFVMQMVHVQVKLKGLNYHIIIEKMCIEVGLF